MENNWQNIKSFTQITISSYLVVNCSKSVLQNVWLSWEPQCQDFYYKLGLLENFFLKCSDSQNKE